MQGSNYITSPAGIKHAETLWLKSFYQASRTAKNLYNLSGTSYRGGNTYPGPIEDTFSDFGEDEDITITKQVVNRLLEPFMWHTVLVTATEFDNFFKLRCPIYKGKFQNWRSWKDVINHAKKENPGLVEDLESYSTIKRLENSISGAEIHMQVLAENMWDAYQESIPKLLQPGEYHIPFGDKIYSENGIEEVLCNHTKEGWVSAEGHDLELDKIAIQIATARCARLSYMTFDNKIDYEKDIKLHDRLLLDKHASPFEHVSRCLTEEEYNTLGKMILDPGKGYIFEKGWVDNFKGFVSYRRILNF
jgi:hypothetical protein